MLAMVDQGVHTHACHHALTWPSGLHGLKLKVVTWQCKGNHLARESKATLGEELCASPWACPCMHDLCGCNLVLSVPLGTSAWLPGPPCLALPHRNPLSSDTGWTAHTPSIGAESLDTHREPCNT